MISEMFIDMILDLQEATAYSTIRRSKRVKKAVSGSRAAIDVAKNRRDPLYIKYERFRQQYLAHKKAIMRKYRARGMRNVRKAL
jgi:hypothetical protein